MENDVLDTIGQQWLRERPDLDAASALAIARLMRVARQLEQVNQQTLKPFGLGLTDHDVLSALRRSGEPFEMTPNGLLAQLILTSGSLTSCLDRLESKGLVHRRPSPEDRRVRIVGLTRRGRRLIDEATDHRFATADALMATLNGDDRVALAQALGILQAACIEQQKKAGKKPA